MEAAASTQPMKSIPPSALLVREVDALGLAVLVVGGRRPGQRWLVADAQGTVLDETPSQFLALARLQFQAASRLADSLRRRADG